MALNLKHLSIFTIAILTFSTLLLGSVVQNATRIPVVGATVALIPPPALRENRMRYQTATTDTKGHFTITNIIPGDYKLFAWPDAPGGAYFNPRFMARYENQGRTVHIDSASASSIDLVAIPQDGR